MNQRSYFDDKWYMREDFNPDTFPKNFNLEFCNYLQRKGNCFDSKESAQQFCDKVIELLNPSSPDQAL